MPRDGLIRDHFCQGAAVHPARHVARQAIKGDCLVSLVPFKDSINRARREMALDYADPREGFQVELQAQGFTPPRVIELSRIQRIQGPGDKPGKPAGWCIYNEFADSQHEGRAFGVGVYGSWRAGERVTWTSKDMRVMSTQEQAHYAAQVEAARVIREAEKKDLEEAAAARAYDIWHRLPEATAANPYLARKGVNPSPGLRELPDRLVLPITVDGRITSLQFILNNGVFEHGTNKKFLRDGRKKGCYLEIPGEGDTIYICEGYATAASVHAATSARCYVAFDSGNLFEAAAHLKNLHPDHKFVIAGDDDTTNGSNTGRIKAQQAADGLGMRALFPNGVKDFNDMQIAQGLDSLRALFTFEPELYEATPVNLPATSIENPPGMLGQIANYYNATSGNKQPLFSIQTAIAITSVICGRNFETNLSNRTSLFLMSIAKSGTGKEHSKKMIEKILDACGMDRLVNGDGYTAGSSVISALQDRPRHITVIDEFSKYLQAANNKYGSSHLMEANAQLMQAISRADGVMRPRAYATLNLSADKRREMAKIKVISPSITLLGMATPDDLFKQLDISSIKDGFINRFVICVSDAERAMREHKEAIDVPQNIIDWAARIEDRRGAAIENSQDDPKLIRLNFTTDAMTLQKEFQQFCIDKANALENLGLAELPGRSNEMAMRLALIAALAIDPYAELIDASCMGWAIEWIKYNMLVLIEKLKMSVSSSIHEGEKKEILKSLRDSKDGVTWTVMQKRTPFSKYKAKDLKDILQALIDAELIVSESFNNGGKGRPTMIYKAIQ